MTYRMLSIMCFGLILTAFSIHAEPFNTHKKNSNKQTKNRNICNNDSKKNSDIKKFITGTLLNCTDTDNDQLTDFFEYNLSLTNPNLPDTDNNGINDSDEDLDNDGLNNLQEQMRGMNPRHAAKQDDVYNFYLLEKTIREDAESGNTDKWTDKKYKKTWKMIGRKSNIRIRNIIDPDNPDNRVIETSRNFGNLCTLKFSEPEFAQFKIQWDMTIEPPYIIIISCMTTYGRKYLYYTEYQRTRRNNNKYIQPFMKLMKGANLHPYKKTSNKNRYIHCFIETNENNRVTIRRDLQQDIWDKLPDCDIIYIDAFRVSGKGYIDNIITLDYADSDHDFIPDSVEDAAGMDKDDQSDAIGDIDGDGLSNLDEFYAGTLELSSITDEDNDKLDDDWEKKYFANLDQDASGDFDKDGLINLEEMTVGTDPTKKDTDGDGWADKQEVDAGMNPNNPDEDNDKLPDGWEMKYFGNMNQTAVGDPDNDKVDNITEYKYGRHPNAGSKRDTANKMRLNISLPLR